MAFGGIGAYPEHHGAHARELFDACRKIYGFHGAGAGVVFGIEVQYDPIPAQGGEGNVRGVLVGKDEIGCGVAGGG